MTYRSQLLSRSKSARRLLTNTSERPSGDHAGSSSRSEEHTSELQSPCNLVCRLLLEKKKIDFIRRLDRIECNSLDASVEQRARDGNINAKTGRDTHRIKHARRS